MIKCASTFGVSSKPTGVTVPEGCGISRCSSGLSRELRDELSQTWRYSSRTSNLQKSLLRHNGAFFDSSRHTRSVSKFFQADKLRNQQELERLQAKYIGTGHPDTTSWEWRTNIQRDTYASIAGHRPLLSYIALAENEPISKVRAQMIRVRLHL